MQLKDKSGIACDKCGGTHQYDFKYYSFDIRQVDVYDNRKPPLEHILMDKPIFSIDICTECFEKYKSDIIKNYSKIMSAQRKQRIDVTCELTGKKLIGTYTYYYVAVTMVNVISSNQPQVCAKCNVQAIDKKCKKCGGTELLTKSMVNATDRYVEFSICQESYETFKTAAEMVRKIGGAWTTKSQ